MTKSNAVKEFRSKLSPDSTHNRCRVILIKDYGTCRCTGNTYFTY
jgi:hypothetical protein